MEKTKFFPSLRLCYCLVFFLSPLIGFSQGSPTLACNDAVQISLGSACGAGDVTSDMFLEGDYSGIAGDVTEVCLFIEYTDAMGTHTDESCVADLDTPFDEIDWSALIGKVISYKLRITLNDDSYNWCWGEAIIEDKLAPMVDCYEEEETITRWIYKYDKPWLIKAIEDWADGFECLDDLPEPPDDPDDCTLDEFRDTIPFFDEHGIVFLDMSGMVDPMPANVTTIYGFENGNCITDNCMEEFEIFFRLGEDPESPYSEEDCPGPGGPIGVCLLEYYILVPQPHGLDPLEVVIAEYRFGVLRPDFPEFPHNVTIYCTDNEDSLTPEAIAQQLDDIDDCGFDDYVYNHYMCDEEDKDDCNEGIPYAFPHWETHDCYQELELHGNHGYCKYFATYDDDVFWQSSCVTKILRRWTVLDWCTGTIETEYQAIERRDETPPKIIGETPHPKEISVQPWLCYANVKIPDSYHGNLEAVDKCSNGYIEVVVYGLQGHHYEAPDPLSNEELLAILNGADPGSYTVIDGLSIGDMITLPVGHYYIVYYAVDDCGNNSLEPTNHEFSSEEEEQAYNDKKYRKIGLWVLDKTPPVPVCEDEVAVSLTFDYGLTDGGVAKVFAESFNSGSHDAGCGDVCLQVIRMEDFNSTPIYGDYEEECSPYHRVVECWDEYPVYTDTPWGYEPVSCYAINDTITVPTGYDHYGNAIECEEVEVASFGDYVKFCCEDLGRDDLFVILRVWDHWGNHNDCMVKVDLQNKIDATIICGKNLYLNCEEYPDPYGYAMSYSPQVEALCDDVDMYYEDVKNLDDCGYGLIHRYWTAKYGDQVVAQCVQYVYVNKYEDYFDPRSIKWPAHHTGETVYGEKIECVNNEPEVTNSNYHFYLPHTLDCMEMDECIPEWDSSNCGLIGWSLESDTVYFEDGACIKILNRWTVIDWCTWNPNQQSSNQHYDDPDPFVWVSDQSLGDCGGASCFDNGYNVYARFDDDTCEFVENSANTNGGGHHDDEHGEFMCDELVLDGYYVWYQVIKVINTSKPEIVDCEDVEIGVDADCKGSIILTNSATDAEDCGNGWMKWKVELFDVQWNLLDYWIVKSNVGQQVVINAATEDGLDSGSSPDGYVDPGTYIARWTVEDGCGNKSVCTQYISVWDKKPPTPICHATISTAFMQPSGQVTIWATDFDLKSFDNCTGEYDLIYTIRKTGSGDDPQSSVIITCEDLVGDLVNMEVWVTDQGGNSDYCDVSVFVSDDSGICEDTGSGTAMVSGILRNEMGDFIESAEVMINSSHPEYPVTSITDRSGQFAFPNNPMNRDYQVSAVRDNDYLNGVSTLDLVLMQKHILGLDLLDSPYKVIAADVNSDRRVSAADLVQLRKLILGILPELTSNDSWRFVDANQKLDGLDPFPFTELISIDKLIADMSDEDFIGVKIGDVSNDARANESVSTEVRSNEFLNFEVVETLVHKGSVVNVPVYASNFAQVYGYQLTLNHHGLEFQAITSDRLDLNEANVASWNDQLTMSWNEGHGYDVDGVLFEIQFKALKDVLLSDVLDINSSLTPAEAYVGEGLDKRNIRLMIRTDDNEISLKVFELYQNQPNPFDTETVIGFYLPNADQATISIMDVSGKLLKLVENEYAQGYHELTIRSEELGVSGVFYYQLESGAYSATKKMILIR